MLGKSAWHAACISRAVRHFQWLPLCLLLGCESLRQEPKPNGYALLVHVESDPSYPLAGARLLHGGRELGVSAADGHVDLRVTGSEGEQLAIEVACPTGFRSLEAALSVTLRHAASSGRPEYFSACPPLTRKLVIAARLEHGSNLPIRYLGRELARSDGDGIAHLLLEGEADKTVELTVDTSEQPQLRPKSPSARFRIGNRDEVVLLAQSFQSPKKPAIHAHHSSGPVRIR
ncbi:MAG TPA: hypothetical protein VGC79_27720 [Polyangiaceae bacterium]